MGQPIERRWFLKYLGKIGIWISFLWFSSLKFGYASKSSQLLANEIKGEPGKKSHHVENGFINPPGSPIHEHDLSNWFKHIWYELAGNKPKLPKDHVIKYRKARSAFETLGNSDKIMWLGHSSFLLRLSNKNILLDPFLSDYATSYPPFGPKRYAPPGLPVIELPQIDLIIISHNHYDHLDFKTLSALPGKRKISIIAPLGLGNFFLELGYEKITELDWHDVLRIKPIKITAIPAVHFSGRGLLDRNKTLWAGFAITDGKTNIYFSCDTAYHSIFEKIGREYGPFDYALVPIGAYRPAPMKNHAHVTPEEAVQMGLNLQSKTLIPTHWGSIILSQAPPFEAPDRFLKAGLKAGFNEANLWVMKIGETRGISFHS